MNKIVRQIPTIITISRVIYLYPILFFLSEQTIHGALISLAFFILAMFSDFLDGFLARSLGAVSSLGQFLDPLIDKIFFAVLYLYFLYLDYTLISYWVVFGILFREVFVTIVRIGEVQEHKNVSAKSLGKIKTLLQTFHIGVMIFCQILLSFFHQHFPNTNHLFWKNTLLYLKQNGLGIGISSILYIPYLLSIIVLLVTVVSGFQYVRIRKATKGV